ncbi:pyruvate, phosphate dikinase, chloroplastic-like [Primulina tabacum]|uniref:pyruvate, phosphate dikinase, chloroplastic-like n=1 Tax=Primulina tabacum TaxID=48773 RepID=UPI003F5A522B
MSEDEVYSRIEKLPEARNIVPRFIRNAGSSNIPGCHLHEQPRHYSPARNNGSSNGTPQELSHQASLVRGVANEVFTEMGASVSYKVGTMIEIPPAALVADEIAKEAEFFSFGTNDLTQMTYGYSRDDVGKFLPIYLSKVHPTKRPV